MCNLLNEGNDLFRDNEWEQAAREFTEGLNVSSYAAAEEIQIPEALLENLYVKRAAAYHSMVRPVSVFGAFQTGGDALTNAGEASTPKPDPSESVSCGTRLMWSNAS